ncbi:MAG: amidohydrolase [Rhizobiales bacterium]|nr:amidohydrolase [Hyphomicrobiales bacterium]
MPTINRFADLHDEIAGWRRELHSHPELGFELPRTSAFVAEKLRALGVDEVVTGMATSGVVAVIRGRSVASGRTIGLRADMDALPIEELRDLPHRSRNPGTMHACGHDGHTAMLLGAARYLAETRNFDGTAVLIFQPAEEGGAGGRVMVEEGLMERFGIQEVYGMHNAPGVPVGVFRTRPGPLMAAADVFEIEVTGHGGHAARPHRANDPIVFCAQLVTAFQTIVSRNVDPVEAAVISVTKVLAGNTTNVIPQTAVMAGTVRTLSETVRDLVERRMGEMVAGMAAAYGLTAHYRYERDYPVLVNHETETEFAVGIARQIVGDGAVDAKAPPVMGAEDFSYMLQARPGAFIFIGQGDSAGLHHPEYDFNDEIIPLGCSYWVKLVETALPAR